MAERKFAHLHLHTHYSLLDGFNRIPPLVEQTKKLGMNACAITDHGNLYGAIEFYNECKKGGVNPIIGYEAYLAPGSRLDKKPVKDERPSSHLTLLAKNATGFKNLIKLSSIAFLEGFYYNPRIDRELLKEHSEGLICLSGCLAGEFNLLIRQEKTSEAEKLAAWFSRVFKNDFYIEIQNNGITEQDNCTAAAADIAQRMGLPLVATADAHYLCAEDGLAHDVLFCINTRRKHDPRKRLYPEERMPNPYYVRSPEDMYRLFPDFSEAVAQSQKIAEGVDIQLDFKKRHFPVFTPPESKTPEDFLRELCEHGLRERYGDNPSEAARKRLEHELGVVCRMGFASYFLIVWDFVRFAREEKIPCSARGSGCGAIVSYVLHLSHVDPLEYDLLFERFLDPNRGEAPDIDIDFCQDRREQVLEYVKRKYGVESVAQIGTFGTLAAKNAMKDVGRALDVPLERVNQMCKLVPMKGAISADLAEAMESPDFRREYDADPQVKYMVDVALKLEGMNRNVGTHAAGVVIANGPITDYVPVQRVVRKADSEDGENGEKGDVAVTTQWEMGVLEKVGMLKMDFLGLRTLTLIDNALKLIKRTRGVDIDIQKIPFDDKAVYQLLQRGDAKGVFQFESEGIRELLKRMKPDNIRDVIACTALYRPGPLEGGMVDEYIECKHGRKKPTYPHPVMEEILGETHGVMVYQEAIMRLLNRLGGIELSSAYACIKAISKKKGDIIDARRADFIQGSQERGLTRKQAEEIFELIVKFGGYGFNKCIVAETEVMDAATGEVITVGELFAEKRTITIHALNEDGKLIHREVTDVMWNGVKPVYRLKTQLGKSICATANHPFRTLNGWTNLECLKQGDRIAVPRETKVTGGASWPRHEIITLAGLLSEGNTCHPSTLYFFGNDRVLVEDFAEAIGQIPDTVARIYTRRNGRRLEVHANTGQDRRFKVKSSPKSEVIAIARSGAFRWAEKLELLGRKATEKRVPSELFQVCDRDLELFLGRLWAGDGFISNAALKVPFYATSSRGLADDVQSLLLRLGIVSRIHEKQFKYRGGTRPGYTVHVLGEGSAETFLERITPHCLGREKAVEVLRSHVSSTTRGLTSKDTVPPEIRLWVNEEREERSLTWVQLELQSGVSTKELLEKGSAKKFGFRRSTIQRLAQFFASHRLEAIATSDVFWDRVASIEYVGERDTYDLTVAVDHNFVANGLIVHNSHSAAYAHISYHTAYLKHYYPAEFMAALLSSEIDDGAKRDMLVEHIADARRTGIEVLPPDVNRGIDDFDVQNNRIIFGLTAIKGLGRGAAEEIVRARQANGKFKDLFDFCERIDRRIVPRSAVEKLVMAGGFDAFGKRAAHYAAVATAYSAADERAADRRRGQKSFLDMFEGGEDADGGSDATPGHGLPDRPEWPETEKLKFEKEALDFYMSSHPLAQHDEQLRRFRTHDASEMVKAKNGTEGRVGGMIVDLQVRTANRGRNSGRKYAMFRIEDFTGSVRCIMWSDEYARCQELMTSDAVYLFEGVLNWAPDRAEPDFAVKKVMTVDEARREFTKSLLLKLPYTEDETALRKLDGVSLLLKRYRGSCPVFLSIRDANGKQVQLKLNDEFRINPASIQVEELEMLLGPGAVLFSR